MPRVSQLPLASGVGTVYVIEGGVSKRVVLGGMALQAPGAVAITGGSGQFGLLESSGSTFGVYKGSGDQQRVLISVPGTDVIYNATRASGTVPQHIWQIDGVERMRLSSVAAFVAGSLNATGNGNFGSGSSAAAVQVNGDASSNVGYYWAANGVFNGQLLHVNGNAFYDSPGFFHIRSLNGATSRLFVSSTGNVGLGTSSPSSRLDVAGNISVSGTQLLGARKTGWSAATGTPTRTSFATGSVTLPQLAERVKALLDDLISHGLIGA